MPKLDEEITDETNEPIHHDIGENMQLFRFVATLMQLPIYPLAVEKLRKDPYTLPPGYHWDTLNLDDPLVVSCFTKQS